MSKVPIFPKRLDWPSAIGNFFLNFGTLEYMILVFLRDRVAPEDYSRACKRHLKDRLLLIAEHLEKNDVPVAQRAAFGDLCERLDPIREIRNHLAHGHFLFHWDLESKKPTITISRAIDLDAYEDPDTKHIGFEELRSAMDVLKDLNERFSELAGFKTSGAPSENLGDC